MVFSASATFISVQLKRIARRPHQNPPSLQVWPLWRARWLEEIMVRRGKADSIWVFSSTFLSTVSWSNSIQSLD
jgi:hypothetical protein